MVLIAQPGDHATTCPRVAVAIGFRMNLFNIGVDGQYRLAAMFAAARRRRGRAAGAARTSIVIIVVAMVVGALWAGIAGLLKVTRGVSEVISTIMLNFIATGVVAYLLTPGRLAVLGAGVEQHRHQADPRRPARCRGSRSFPGPPSRSTASSCSRSSSASATGSCSTAPGSASTCAPPGASEPAAVASGVNVKRMVARQHAALRRGRRPGRHAAAARRVLHLLAGLPGRARASPASPSRCSAATTRSASPSARCCGRSWTRPGRSSTSRASPRRSSRSCRASSCCPSSSPTSWSAATVWPSSSARSAGGSPPSESAAAAAGVAA